VVNRLTVPSTETVTDARDPGKSPNAKVVVTASPVYKFSVINGTPDSGYV